MADTTKENGGTPVYVTNRGDGNAVWVTWKGKDPADPALKAQAEANATADASREHLSDISKGFESQAEMIAEKIAQAIAEKLGQIMEGPSGAKPEGGGGEGSAGDKEAKQFLRNAENQMFLRNFHTEELEREFSLLTTKVLDQSAAMHASVEAHRTAARIIEQTARTVAARFSQIQKNFYETAAEFLSGERLITSAIGWFRDGAEMAKSYSGSMVGMLENALNIGPDIARTFKSITKNIEAGGASYAASSMSLADYATSLRRQRRGLSGADGILDLDAQTELLQSVHDQLMRQGIRTDIDSSRVQQAAQFQLNYMKEIAKNTGRSVEQLMAMNADGKIAIDEAVSRGSYTADQGAALKEVSDTLMSAIPQQVEKFNKMVAANGNAAIAFSDETEYFATGLPQMFEQIVAAIKSGKGVDKRDLSAMLEQISKNEVLKSAIPGTVLGNYSGIISQAARGSSVLSEQAQKEAPDTMVESTWASIKNFFSDYLNPIVDFLSGAAGLASAMRLWTIAAAVHAHAMYVDIAAERGGKLLSFLANPFKLAWKAVTGSFNLVVRGMLGGISGLTRMASEFGLTAGQALFRMGVVAAATAGAIMDINNALTQTQEERDKFGDDTAGWIGQAFSDLAGVVVAGVAGLVAFLAGGPVAWIAGVAYLVYKGIDWLFGMFGISISDGIGYVAKWIYEGASWLISGLWDVISSAWDSLSGWIGGLWDNIKSFFSRMWDWLDGFMPWNWFGDSDASVSDPASDIISGSVTESLKQVMEKHSERVIEKESARGEATTPFLIKMVQSLEKIESHSRPRTGYQTG